MVLVCLMVMLSLLGCTQEKEPQTSEPDPVPEEETPSQEDEETLAPGEEEETIVEEEEKEKIIATNLSIPWSIEYDGMDFYISQRVGTIAKITPDGIVEEQKVVFNERLSDAAEAGFLGFLLHPEKKDTALAYYTYENSRGQYNRIVELEWDGKQWIETKVILDRIPSGYVHHGGRMKIGPDGKLYVTTGDAYQPNIAQNLNSLGGKILRMNLDGSIPEDNPFEGSYVFSYGHRNPQGLVWDENGSLFSSEHGQTAHDEINRIEAAANYGWPHIQGDEEAPGMKKPLAHSGDNTWAPSGMAYWKGLLYVAQLRGQGIMAVNPETGETKQVITGYGRIRDVYVIGDYIYFVTNNTDGRGDPTPEDDRFVRIKLEEVHTF